MFSEMLKFSKVDWATSSMWKAPLLNLGFRHSRYCFASWHASTWLSHTFFLSHGSLAWLKLSLLQKLVRGKIGGWPAILTHNFLISAAGVAAPFGLQVYHALEFSYKKGYGNIYIYIQITHAQHTHICVYIYIRYHIYIDHLILDMSIQSTRMYRYKK